MAASLRLPAGFDSQALIFWHLCHTKMGSRVTFVAMYSIFEYHSADGTVRGLTNNGDGPVVVVCNGLGVP